jgi:antitoxin (DNA-binding transcriptional repressor) of toxin-antitoxin stability system
MNSMTVKQAELAFSDVIETVRRGETVILTEDGISLATIVPTLSEKPDQTPEVMKKILALREEIKGTSTIEEILAWRHEGHPH